MVSNYHSQLVRLADTIKNCESILLTTHRFCDGDGLGSLLGMYHGLKKIGKKVRAVTVDEVSMKYDFLFPEKHTESFERLKTPIEQTDLAIIFDTNDKRLIQPLYGELKKKCQKILFVDHHPFLTKGPSLPDGSLVDRRSASTGEICFSLIKLLDISFDSNMATAIYCSIVFDTQRFHFIKNSARSYEICAELYSHVTDHKKIYSNLFSVHSKEKMNMLSRVIKKMEYLHGDQIMVLEISKEELIQNGLDMTDAYDFIDLALGIVKTKLVVLILDMMVGKYKVSFRSKKWNVSQLAERFGGGGHKYSSGATLLNCEQSPKSRILTAVREAFEIN